MSFHQSNAADIDAIREELAYRAEQRSQRWDTRLTAEFTDDWVRYRWPSIIGAYSHTYFGPQRRDLLAKDAIPLGKAWETPPSVARDYLVMTYRRRRGRLTVSQSQRLEKIQMPLYARPGVLYGGRYVDVKSAWWSILLRAGWDVDYSPNEWLSPGRPPHDFPFPNNKVARSALVSVGRKNEVSIYHPEAKPEQIENPNPNEYKAFLDSLQIKERTSRSYNSVMNWGIFALIADVLRGVALEAQQHLGHHLYYWNIDGAIVTGDDAYERLNTIIASWGLEARVKHSGDGWVAGVGSFAVGFKKSAKEMEPQAFALDDTLAGSDPAWLKPIWRSLLQHRGWDVGPDTHHLTPLVKGN